MGLPNTLANMRFNPDLKSIKHFTADALTGKGVWADTEFDECKLSGWFLSQYTVTGAGDSLIYVDQENHKENRSNNIPVLGSGVAPDLHAFVAYKQWIEKGETPGVLYDEVSDTAMCAVGALFQGLDNPVAMETADITVFQQVAATTQNVLEGTDLEDCPYPGYLLVWCASDQVDSQIQVNQKGHTIGRYSLMPSYASGLAVNINAWPSFKKYIPVGTNPVITITEATAMAACVLAQYFIDWDWVRKNRPFKSMRNLM